MYNDGLTKNIDATCQLVEMHAQQSGRIIIGIAGPPASGKTTLTQAVIETLNETHTGSVPRASSIPMDGYHLDNVILEQFGLLSRKGSPETFDAYGFCETIKKLPLTDQVLYFPKFDRDKDLAVANAIPIHPKTEVIIVEGNYLLLKQDPWCHLAELFSATIFISPKRDVLEQRLQQRWEQHGLDRAAATQRIDQNDLVNADMIIHHSKDADLLLR